LLPPASPGQAGFGLFAIILAQAGPAGRHHARRHNAAHPTADDGRGRAKGLRHCAGFNLTQLRAALEENLIDA